MDVEEYPPLNTLKPVADNIWIVDGPKIYMAFPLGIRVPFPTRMTLIRLKSGGLFVHSPTAPDEAMMKAIDDLGPVEHLLSSNMLHYANIAAWKERYPDAIAWAAPKVRDRAKAQNIEVSFDRDLGEAPDVLWADDIDQLIFAGSKVLDEVVFFHRDSKTVILTDLIENFESEKVSPGLRMLVKMAGAVDPDGKAPIDLRLTFAGGKDAARESLAQMLAWQPERVILAHGRWYESQGTEELRRAFRWLL